MTNDNIRTFIQVNVSIDGEAWNEVATFENKASDEQVYILDRNSGTVLFGDGKHGRRPPAGSRIEATYRTGGGSVGNVLSFTWTMADPHIHKALSAAIITLPDSFRLRIYQVDARSWRWKFATWLCDVLKVNL
jgi:hypothetical protein